MSWRVLSLAFAAVVAVSCASCASGNMRVKKGEPQTAREKMLAEEKAKHENDKSYDEDAKPPGSKKWTGWRYGGDRKQCFFVVGRKCFKTENAACQAAKCKGESHCETEGAGPATMTCSKGKKDKDTE